MSVLHSVKTGHLQIDLLDAAPQCASGSAIPHFYNWVYSYNAGSFVMCQGQHLVRNVDFGLDATSSHHDTLLMSMQKLAWHGSELYSVDSCGSRASDECAGLFIGLKFIPHDIPSLGFPSVLPKFELKSVETDMLEAYFVHPKGRVVMSVGAACGITLADVSISVLWPRDCPVGALQSVYDELAAELITIFDDCVQNMIVQMNLSKPVVPASMTAVGEANIADSITFTVGGVSSPVLVIKADGTIAYKGKDVEGDADFKAAMIGLHESLRSVIKLGAE